MYFYQSLARMSLLLLFSGVASRLARPNHDILRISAGVAATQSYIYATMLRRSVTEVEKEALWTRMDRKCVLLSPEDLKTTNNWSLLAL